MVDHWLTDRLLLTYLAAGEDGRRIRALLGDFTHGHELLGATYRLESIGRSPLDRRCEVVRLERIGKVLEGQLEPPLMLLSAGARMDEQTP